MSKIAVVGDSHVAMLIHAWPSLRPHLTDVALDFYAWYSGGTKSLIISGKGGGYTVEQIKIYKDQENVLNVSHYDAILVCGLGYSLRPLLGIYKQHRTHEQMESTYLITDDCWLSTVEAIISGTLAFKLATLIRSITDLPVFLMPAPMGSELLLDANEGPNLYKLCVENEDEHTVFNTFRRASRVFEPLRVTLVEQPSGTIVRHIFTTANYSNAVDLEKSAKYIKSRGRRDLYHMNSEFGRIMLCLFFGQLGLNFVAREAGLK